MGETVGVGEIVSVGVLVGSGVCVAVGEGATVGVVVSVSEATICVMAGSGDGESMGRIATN